MSSYVIGVPVHGAEFYGRQRIVRRVLDHFGWTWICGQRRMGKTSLLYYIAEAARQQGGLPLLFDLARLSNSAPTGFELLQKFLRQHLRQGGALADCGLRAEELLPSTGPIDAAEGFGELFQRLSERGRPIIVLWDEAERLLSLDEHDPGFLERFRAHTHAMRGLRVVISGAQSLSGLFGRPSQASQFLATFQYLPLPALEAEEAAALLRRDNSRDWKTPLKPSILTAAMAWSGGHPYFLQCLGAELAQRSDFQGRRVDAKLLSAACDAVLDSLTVREIVREDHVLLTPPQQALVAALCADASPLSVDALSAQTGLSPEKLGAALRDLIGYGYLLQQADGHTLRFRFYRQVLPASSNFSKVEASKMERIQRDTPPATSATPTVSNGTLRRIIDAVCKTEPDLDAFLIDEFPGLHLRLASVSDRIAKVNLLLQLVDAQELLDRLRKIDAETVQAELPEP